MRTKKLKIGDIYEIKTPIGLAYFQYTHDGRDNGALIRVLPGVYTSRPQDFGVLGRQKELYFVFYTLEYDLRSRKVESVSNQPVPEWAKEFPTMRKRGGVARGGGTLNWFIGHGLKLDRIGEMRQALNVRELTPEQKKLSIAMLTNYGPLVKDIVRGWTPERDQELIDEEKKKEAANTAGTTKPASPNVLDHYLYFPKKNHADEAARRLRAKGWQVDVRLGADGENWLALAKQPVKVDEEIDEVRDELESIADELHGEYDGWGTGLL